MSQFPGGGINFATAYLDLALRGGQNVGVALAQMQQQFRRTTAAATDLKNILNVNLGAGLAQQHLGTQALMAQLKAAEAGAGARAMAAPSGQQALRQQFAAQSATTAGVLRQQLAAGRAQAAFAATPGGQQASAEIIRLRKEKEEQDEARHRRETIQQYGHLVGGMRIAGTELRKLVPGIGVATAAFGAVASVVHTALRFAAIADPVGARQKEVAQQAVDIQVGRRFVGLQRGEAGHLLREAEELRNNPPGVVGSLFRAVVPDVVHQTLRALSVALPDSLRDQSQLDRERALLRRQEFAGPFTSRMLSAEQLGDAMQLAGTNQTMQEAQNLQDQLRNYLEESNNILTRIETNTGGLRNLEPAWR